MNFIILNTSEVEAEHYKTHPTPRTIIPRYSWCVCQASGGVGRGRGERTKQAARLDKLDTPVTLCFTRKQLWWIATASWGSTSFRVRFQRLIFLWHSRDGDVDQLLSNIYNINK